jgi:hypothetical protein
MAQEMESKLLPVYRILAELWIVATIFGFVVIRLIGSASFKHMIRVFRAH